MASPFDLDPMAAFLRPEQRIPRGALLDRAFGQVGRLIASLELEPGQAFGESELCARLGLTKTPVREALLVLRHMGLVEAQAGSGYRVRPLDDPIGLWRSHAAVMREASARFGAVDATAGAHLRVESLRFVPGASIEEHTPEAVSAYVNLFLVGQMLLVVSAVNPHLVQLLMLIQPNLERSMRMALRAMAAEDRFPPPLGDLEVVVAAFTGDGETARSLLRSRVPPAAWVFEALGIDDEPPRVVD